MDNEDKDGNEWLPVEFTTKITLDVETLRSPNLVPRFSEDEMDALGHMVVEDFERDRQTRFEWEQRMANALRLALQVTEKKTFPWEGAANVKFPLITIAAMQYQSRAYPALVNGPSPVAARPLVSMPKMRMPPMPPQQQGQQPDPKAQAAMQQFQQQAQQVKAKYDAECDRAEAIANHMSYQILEEDEQWEENHDKALLIQSILGCVFKKSYFDPIRCHNVSECVSPRDIVVDYFTQSIETAPRLTHIVYLSANDCYERTARGIFSAMHTDAPKPDPKLTYATDQEQNERMGLVQQPDDHDAPYELLEQHRTLDFDGDGYGEPYTVTVRYDTRQVLRIVPRFTRSCITYAPTGKLLRIEPVCAFTKYPFIPSPDGGFYDLGFGALLGPINETIDSAINQLLDAGTLQTAGGGFVGRGFKNKKGEYRFRPGEWKTVDSTGDDIRKNVVPLPTNPPSPALFQLLTLLIEYGEAVAGAVDILQGKNPGQNTPAETSRAMVEQGMKVFNGIYKRTHRAQTQEFRKLYRLNTIFLSEDMPYYARAVPLESQSAAGLYKGANVNIRCSADPFYMSDAQRYNQATALLQAAHASPGYDLYQVNRYYLQALKIPSIDTFLPDPKGPFAVPPMPNPKIVEAQMKAQAAQLKEQLNFKMKLMELIQKAELQAAQIKLMEAQAVQALAEAKGVDTGHQIALLDAQIAAAKNKQEGTLEAIKLLHEMSQGDEDGGSKSGGMGSMAGSSGDGGAMGNAATAPQGPGGGPFGALPTAGSPF